MSQHLQSLPAAQSNAVGGELVCRLCGNRDVAPIFSEQREGRIYTSYHCRVCDLYQTLGSIDPVSPDYIDLEGADLDEGHRFLQTAHKLPAFEQWSGLISERRSDFSNMSLLDIGCGVGGFLDYAKAKGLSTYGFDASRAHAEDARQRHQNVRQSTSVEAYLQQLSSAPTIDLVTLWDVFEHVREPRSLLNEVLKLLSSSKGLLFISVPCGTMNRTKARIAGALGRPIGLIPWEHVFYYTPRSLRLVLTTAGFEILRIGGVQPYVRPLGTHEVVRRAAHHVLKHTSAALQIFALARPRGGR